MKTVRLLIALLLSFNLVTAPVVRASFDDVGAGARGPGMADTFTGVADTADATAYNPAGLVQLKNRMLSSEYSTFLKGLDDGSSVGLTYLSYAHPLHDGAKGVMGLSYQNLAVSDILNERTLSLSYGWNLKTEPFGWKGKWSLGGALKQLHRQYQSNGYTGNAVGDNGATTGQGDPLFIRNGYGSDAYALDLAALYRFGPHDKYSAGLMLRNANQPDVSLGGDGDKAPRAVKLGFGVRPKWGLFTAELRRIERLQSTVDTETAIGAERHFRLESGNAVQLRGGYASGSRNYRAISLGASYHISNVIIDYALNLPAGTLKATDGGHRIGLSYKFGKLLEEEKAAEETPTAHAETTPIPTPETPAPTPAVTPLPEAPAALTAPVPVKESTAPVKSEFDESVKSFGALLGHYITRVNNGATVDERRALLKEIKALYGAAGIDMTYINNELKSVGEQAIPKPSAPAIKPVLAPTPKPVSKPVAVPVVKPAAKPSAKPTGASNADMDRAWSFYRQAVERGITDSERIEILENILLRFGESTADKVVKELEKVRKRLE